MTAPSRSVDSPDGDNPDGGGLTPDSPDLEPSREMARSYSLCRPLRNELWLVDDRTVVSGVETTYPDVGSPIRTFGVVTQAQLCAEWVHVAGAKGVSVGSRLVSGGWRRCGAVGMGALQAVAPSWRLNGHVEFLEQACPRAPFSDPSRPATSRECAMMLSRAWIKSLA